MSTVPSKQDRSSFLEDYGVSPVPESARKGWFGIGVVYWGSAVCLPAFLVAGLIAAPLSLWHAILVYVAGAAVLALIAVFSGVIGAHTGLSTGLSVTYTFGRKGATAVQLALFFASWGWFGVQLGFMATGLGDGGLAFALSGAVPGWVIQVLGGVLMTLSAMIGFKAIEKLSAFAMPFLLFMLIITIVRLYANVPSLSEIASQTMGTPMNTGAAISIVISSFVLGALIAPDITRYARSTRAAAGGMVFGMFIGFSVVLTLAAFMVKGAEGEPDFSKIMLSGGGEAGILMTILASLTIVLAAWTTNHTNLYSSALSFNAIFPSLKTWQITLFSGVVGTGLALAGINTSGGFQAFLNLLAVLLPPAAAVMVVDFFVSLYRKSDRYRSAPDSLPSYRSRPLIAWGIGAICGFIVQYSSVQITSITALDTILVAAMGYLLLIRLAPQLGMGDTPR